jgi:hypothetical protein
MSQNKIKVVIYSLLLSLLLISGCGTIHTFEGTGLPYAYAVERLPPVGGTGLPCAHTIVDLRTFRGTGFLYTRTVEPLSRHNKPVQAFSDYAAQGDRKGLEIQNVSVIWDDNAIGEIARKSGLKKIYYSDLETRRVLFWSRQIVHVYGTAEEPED